MEPLTYLHKAIFALLILGGHICFPVMLLCIFISRHPISGSKLFLHFCFSWVVHSVGFSILFYSGNATGPEPAFGPCILQAVLVYIVPVLETSFLCALVYHLCFTIEVILNYKAEMSELRMMMLVTGPYFVSLVPAFAVSVVATTHPEFLYRGDNYYCALSSHIPTDINATIAGIFLCTSVFLQCRIGLLLYKNRLILKQVMVQGFELFHLFIRLSFFILITVVGVAMVLVVVVDRMNKSRIVYQAALPLLAFVTFGTRLSIYRLRQRKEGLVEGERQPAQRQPQTAKVIV